MELFIKILKFLLKPVFLVSVGILMTVSSAIISNYLLEENNLRLSKINQKSVVIDEKINSYWKYIESSERKIDLAIIALSGSYNTNTGTIIEQYFSAWLDNIISSTDLKLNKSALLEKENNVKDKIIKYIELIKLFKSKAIGKIDSLYIEKINIEKQRDYILERNMFLKNVALLLQILGLILVLSRNIFSH